MMRYVRIWAFGLFLLGCGATAPGPTTPVKPVGLGFAHIATDVTVRPERDPEEDAAIPIAPKDPVWGARTAPVTLVEFADFACPYCTRVEPTLKRMRDKYGPAKLRVVWKNDPLPFHPDARPLAEAAAGVFELAGNDAFWRFREWVLASTGHLTEDALVAGARAAGVAGGDAYRAGLRSHRWAGKVESDLAEARELGAVGTPWFFINGLRVVGAQPDAVFQTLIDAQLVAAEGKISSGVAPERVYAVLSKENRAAEPRREDPADEADDKTVFRVPLGKSPARGSATALVTVVEFADYECSYCARVEPTLRELRAQYADKVRFVMKDEPLPFHAKAEPAAQAALEVRAEKGDAAFWTMHDQLFEHQDDLGLDALVHLAEGVGARPDRVRAAIAMHAHAAAIEADSALADDLGADGTPQFFINGRRLVGAQPKERFATIFDEEIKKAEARIGAGTKPDAVYEALTKDGVTPSEPERKDVAGLPHGDPARGAAAAKVVVHEFADFECSYCLQAEATLKEVARVYGSRVRFVWHDLPLSFHPNALVAARAGREAQAQRGDSAFWELHDRLMREGAKLSRTDLDAEGRALGLDMTQWGASLDGGAHTAAIDADEKAAGSLGVNGTPSFLVARVGAKSGYALVGAQPFAKFKKLIERVIAEAK